MVLNLVVTRNVFSKCPRHCAFVSVSNVHVFIRVALNKLGSESMKSTRFRMPRALGSGLAGAWTATARGSSAF